MALRGVRRIHMETAIEIYSVFGNKPFTPPELYAEVGHKRFGGFLLVAMRRNKYVKEIDKEYLGKERTIVRTYRLTKEMIDWMDRKGYINKYTGDVYPDGISQVCES